MTAAGTPDDDPEPARWTPDDNLVPSVLQSPRARHGITALSPPDRAWLIAGLKLAGMSSRECADRLGCSIRFVKTIRADPLTAVCTWAQQQVAAATAAARAERAAHLFTRAELTRARNEATRLRAQLDQLAAALADRRPVETCVWGHPLVGDNVYRSGGRRYCKACRRERRRAKKPVLTCN